MTVEWRRLGDHETDHERIWLGVGALGVLAALLIAGAPGAAPMCPWKAVTGLPCPTCGTLRAVLALVRGLDLFAALRWNPLAALGAIAWVAWGGYAIVVLAARLPRLRITWSSRDIARARWLTVTAVAATWAFLLIDGR